MNYQVDLISGARTYQLDLGQLPFHSRLGANDGKLEIACDRHGRITGAKVEFIAPKRFLLDELDRIAQETSWEVPVDEIRAAPTHQFVVDMVLKPPYLAELETLDLSDPNLDVKVGWYPGLLDDRNYAIENIRIEEAPR